MGNTMQEPPESMIELAAEISLRTTCLSKRGVIIWRHDDMENPYVARATNGPAGQEECSGNSACKATCSRFSVHAEQRALIAAGKGARGAEMLHIKTVNGQIVASGPPSCPQCSKLLVESGIKTMWLLHEDGWRRYPTEEFHRLTLDHCRSGAGHQG